MNIQAMYLRMTQYIGRGSATLRALALVSLFSRNRLAVFGLILFSTVVIAALLAPIVAPEGPFVLSPNRLRPPSFDHLFGTDHLGRDVFVGALYGARTSLLVGFVSTALSLTIGLITGMLGGYYRGWVDDVIMRTAEIFQVMPRFFLALIIVAIFGAGLMGIIIVIGLLNWAETARIVRGEFITLRERSFVVAARTLGLSDVTIMAKEILPNALTPVIVATSLQVASAILLEASLSFLGVGDSSAMSWGSMLNDSQQFLRRAWWTATFPGLALCLVTFGVALIADGLNDMRDPRFSPRARG